MKYKFKCDVCGKKTYKKGLCSDCGLMPKELRVKKYIKIKGYK